MIILLTIFLLLMFILAYLFNKDILFPSNMLNIAFLLFSFLTVILMNQLKIDILFKSFLLIILFVLSFSIFSHISYFIGDYLLAKNNLNYNTNYVSFINVSNIKIMIVLIIQLIALFSFIFKLKTLLGSINSETLQVFRSSTFYNNTGLNYTIPSWISFLNNFTKFSSMFSIFIIINNHFSNIKKYKSKFLLIVSSIIYMPITLLNSSRYDIIIIIFYSLFIYIFYLKYLHKNILKALLFIIVIILSITLLFGFIGILIGRDSSSIVTYAGGSIALFNNYIQFPVHYTGFGPQTFDILYKGLHKLNLINNYTPMNTQEFRSINGYQIGNVYTALRYYYGDFGITGLLTFSGLYGVIFGYFYRKIRSIKLDGISLWLIIYAYMSWTLILSPYSETFNNTFLSLGFLNNIFILILLKIYYSYI